MHLRLERKAKGLSQDSDIALSASKEAAILLAKKYEDIFTDPNKFILFMQSLIMSTAVFHLQIAGYQLSDEIIRLVIDSLTDKEFFENSVHPILVNKKSGEVSGLEKIPEERLKKFIEDEDNQGELVDAIKRELYKRSLKVKE